MDELKPIPYIKPDFYLKVHDSGCCLKCSDAEPGCLCYECKCKKCYWYIPPEEWDGESGRCRKAINLKKGIGVVPFPNDLWKKNIKVEEVKPKEWLK